jgi:hypothetical protein
MKIVRYINDFSAFQRVYENVGLVVVCGCLVKGSYIFSHLKPSAILRLHVRYDIHRSFKYASDFIWFLGSTSVSKNCLVFLST